METVLWVVIVIMVLKITKKKGFKNPAMPILEPITNVF
jgi:hypothetical protein